MARKRKVKKSKQAPSVADPVAKKKSFWEALQTPVGVMAGIIAILATLAGGIYFLYPFYLHRQRYRDCRTAMNDCIVEYCRKDDFEGCIKALDKAKEGICSGEAETHHEIQKARLFAIATKLDQFKLLDEKNENELKDIKSELVLAKSQVKPVPAELRTLDGIIHELSGEPNTAIKVFAEIEKESKSFPNLYNYWGYTIKKWKMGSDSWENAAIFRYDQAIELSESLNIPYLMPFINKADVYLTRAADEMRLADSQPADRDKLLAGALDYIRKAENALTKADEIEIRTSEINPTARKEFMWGNLHLISGVYYSQINRNETALEEYRRAAENLKRVRKLNANATDALSNLGMVYWQLSKLSTDEDYEGLAKNKFEEVLRLSLEPNLDACEWTAQISIELGSPDRAQIDKCASIITERLKKFKKLGMDSTDEDAKRWYEDQVRDLEGRSKAWDEMLKTLDE
jgi:tetratricopeptide (TPR) repeat protein